MAAAAAVGTRSRPGGACRKRQFRPSTCASRPPLPVALCHLHPVQQVPPCGRGGGPRIQAPKGCIISELGNVLSACADCRLRTS